ncbi:MAG: hypothetical protein ACRDK9_02585 [Solirubrobacterales bacterium]
MRKGVDLVSLIAGVTVSLIGTLLVLDQSRDLELSPGVLAALFVGAFGLIMLLSGLLEDR